MLFSRKKPQKANKPPRHLPPSSMLISPVSSCLVLKPAAGGPPEHFSGKRSGRGKGFRGQEGLRSQAHEAREVLGNIQDFNLIHKETEGQRGEAKEK